MDTPEIGQRVREKNSSTKGNVTGHVIKEGKIAGFKWGLDKPVSLGARYGTYQEGETYPEGYFNWEALNENEKEKE